MLIKEQEPRFLEREEAHELTELLNSTEDACDWTYRVVPSPRPPLYHIEVKDEDGEVLGYL